MGPDLVGVAVVLAAVGTLSALADWAGPRWLTAVAVDPDAKVREAVAANPSCPPLTAAQVAAGGLLAD